MQKRKLFGARSTTLFQAKIIDIIDNVEITGESPLVLVSKENFVYVDGVRHSSYVMCPYEKIIEARIGKLDFTKGELAGKDSVCF